MKKLEIFKQQSDILSSFQEELDSFKKIIEKKEKGEQVDFDIEKYEAIFYKALLDLKNNIKDKKDISIFEGILKKIENPSEQISSIDLDSLKKILTKLGYVELEQTDLEKLKISIEESKKLKGEFSQLQNTIVKSNFIPEVKEVKQKIEKYKEKLKVYSKKHPIWTKALILLLPEKLQILFKEKKKSNNLGNEVFGGVLSSIKESFSFLTNFMAQIAVIFFSWFAPKEMKELLEKMTEDFGNIDSKLLERVGAGAFAGSIKNMKEISPDRFEHGKEKLLTFMENKGAEWFGIISDKKKAYRKALNEWFDKIKSDEQINKFLDDLLSGKVDLEKFSLDEILTSLGVGIKGALSLIESLYENDLISFKQIGLKILEKGGQIFIQTALFFPKAIYSVFGEYKLEDFYDYVKSNELSEVNKDMFLVMIYRAINTPPFSILQHIAALPGYALSAVANFGESVTKGKIFFESLKGNIDSQLKLLSEIESQITNREGNIYKGIRESLNYYRKGLIVSYAFGKSRNYNEFSKIISQIGLDSDKEIKSLLEELSRDYSKTKISSFISSMGEHIKSIANSSEYASSRALIENLKSEVGGVFGHTNFFQEVTKSLSKTLESNAKILYQPKLLEGVERLFKKIKYSKIASGNVELLDLSHLTKDPSSLKDVAKDLKILAKQSPDLLRFIFRNTPVILLGKDIIDAAKNGGNVAVEILKTYMEFVPIVGPLVFISGEYSKGDLSLSEMGGTVIWLGLDTFYIYKMRLINPFKLATMPVIDTAKFISHGSDILARYSKGVFEKITKLKLKGRLAIAGAFLLAVYGLYKYLDKDSISDNEVISLLDSIAKTDHGVESVNEALVKNWNSLAEKVKKQLLIAFIGRYLQLDPDSLEKYFDDVIIENNNYILEFTNSAVNSEYVREKLKEIEPIVSQLQDKLNINIELSPKNIIA